MIKERNGNPTRQRRRRRNIARDQLSKIIKMAHADHMCGPLSMRMAFPFDLLVRLLCPSIIGHDTVKAVVLLGLLGGTPPSSAELVNMRSGV